MARATNKKEELQAQEVQAKEDDKAVTRAYTLPEVYQMALKGQKFRRIGWKQKELENAYITVRRGETKLSFCKGNSCVPYQPSQEDAITPDWEVAEDE